MHARATTLIACPKPRLILKQCGLRNNLNDDGRGRSLPMGDPPTPDLARALTSTSKNIGNRLASSEACEIGNITTSHVLQALWSFVDLCGESSRSSASSDGALPFSSKAACQPLHRPRFSAARSFGQFGACCYSAFMSVRLRSVVCASRYLGTCQSGSLLAVCGCVSRSNTIRLPYSITRFFFQSSSLLHSIFASTHGQSLVHLVLSLYKLSHGQHRCGKIAKIESSSQARKGTNPPHGKCLSWSRSFAADGWRIPPLNSVGSIDHRSGGVQPERPIYDVDWPTSQVTACGPASALDRQDPSQWVLGCRGRRRLSASRHTTRSRCARRCCPYQTSESSCVPPSIWPGRELPLPDPFLDLAPHLAFAGDLLILTPPLACSSRAVPRLSLTPTLRSLVAGDLRCLGKL